MRRIKKDGRTLFYAAGQITAKAILNFAVLGCTIATSAQAADSDAIASGVYALRTQADSQLDFRKVYLAVDHGQISGYFDNPYTQPVRNVPDLDPTCRFLLQGIVTNGNHIVMESFYPNKDSGKVDAGGTLTLTKQGNSWEVSVDGDFPNCEVATVESGDTLTFSKAQPDWRGFAYVTEDKASLYNEPSPSGKSGAYLVHYDPIALLRQPAKSGWLYADYFKSRKGDMKRWIKSTDVRER